MLLWNQASSLLLCSGIKMVKQEHLGLIFRCIGWPRSSESNFGTTVGLLDLLAFCCSLDPRRGPCLEKGRHKEPNTDRCPLWCRKWSLPPCSYVRIPVQIIFPVLVKPERQNWLYEDHHSGSQIRLSPQVNIAFLHTNRMQQPTALIAFLTDKP